MLKGQLQHFSDSDYEQLRSLQQKTVQAVAQGKCLDQLFLGTHAPVITLGRGFHIENLLPAANPTVPMPKIVEVERGGDATYHGPGQLIGYPIINLKRDTKAKVDLHRYLRDLEQILINVVAALGIRAERKAGYTGVWVGAKERKIASIGIAVKQWVTYHGFALNVGVDLDAFHRLRPCGLEAAVMTSIEKELGQSCSLDSITPLILAEFRTIVGIDFQ